MDYAQPHIWHMRANVLKAHARSRDWLTECKYQTNRSFTRALEYMDLCSIYLKHTPKHKLTYGGDSFQYYTHIFCTPSTRYARYACYEWKKGSSTCAERVWHSEHVEHYYRHFAKLAQRQTHANTRVLSTFVVVS